MVEQLLQEIEELVGTNELEYKLDEKMMQIEQEGAGLELVTPILQMMELLKESSSREDVEPEIRERAQEYMEFQENR